MKTIFYLKGQTLTQVSKIKYIPRIGEMVSFIEGEHYFVKGVVYRYHQNIIAIHLNNKKA